MHTLKLSFAISLLSILACQQASEETVSEADSPSPAARLADEARARLQASPGGELVLKTINAHGGLEAWYQAPTSSYCWEYSNNGAQLRFKSCMTAENSSRRVYHELKTLGSPDNAPAVEGSFAWDGEEAWIYPAEIEKVNPRFWALTGYYFQQIPFVLADPGVNYEQRPDTEIDGVQYATAACTFDSGIGDAPGDAYILYIDKETSLLRGITYTVTYYSAGRGGGARKAAKKKRARRDNLFLYEDYTTVDGLTTPQRFRGFNLDTGSSGDMRNEAWVTEISFSKPFDESKLKMPEGGRIQPMP